MRKVTVFLVVVAIACLFYIIINSFKKNTGEDVNNSTVEKSTTSKIVRPSESVQHKYSMKQIDSVSANLNYKFTVENKVPDSVAILAEKNKEAKSKAKN